MENTQKSLPLFSVIISCIVANLGSKLILNYFSFSFTLFVDDFDMAKFLIDMSVFICLSCLTGFLVKAVSNGINKKE